jgi:hypothetical protein
VFYCKVLTKFERKVQRMKNPLLILTAITLIALSCNKDTYTTRPKLTFKSVNGSSFSVNQTILFNIEFTDKEGDLQDSVWIQKITRTTGCNNFADRLKIPEFVATSNLKGTLEIGYAVGFNSAAGYPILPQCPIGKNDTCYFKFWARDKQKNVSDTVVSPTIVILK